MTMIMTKKQVKTLTTQEETFDKKVMMNMGIFAMCFSLYMKTNRDMPLSLKVMSQRQNY